MVVERRDASGAVVTMATFDLSTLENGLVLEAWNILRVVAETDASQALNDSLNDSLKLSVYFNPMCEWWCLPLETFGQPYASPAIDHARALHVATSLVLVGRRGCTGRGHGTGHLQISRPVNDPFVSMLFSSLSQFRRQASSGTRATLAGSRDHSRRG